MSRISVKNSVLYRIRSMDFVKDYLVVFTLEEINTKRIFQMEGKALFFNDDYLMGLCPDDIRRVSYLIVQETLLNDRNEIEHLKAC